MAETKKEAQSSSRTSPQPASRTGRSVRLIAVNASHSEFLYSLATDEDIGFRWILGGQVPRREVFDQQLWSGVLSQFVVCRKPEEVPIGVVVAYGAELNHGYAYLGAALTPEAVGTGVGIEAVDLFVDYLFKCFDLRKLYFDVPEYNISEFESLLGTVLKQEGKLRDHFYYGGQHWNKIILALYRNDYISLSNSVAFGRRRRLAQ